MEGSSGGGSNSSDGDQDQVSGFVTLIKGLAKTFQPCFYSLLLTTIDYVYLCYAKLCCVCQDMVMSCSCVSLYKTVIK